MLAPIEPEQILGYTQVERLNKIHEATDFLERELAAVKD